MAWRGACQRAGGGDAAAVFSPPAPTRCVRAGGRLPQANAPILEKSLFFLFFSFVSVPFPFLGGERSGVQPHGASHPAAPQAGAGHRPGGGQHLRVLQRSLSAPAAAAAAPPFLLTAAFSRIRPWLSWGRRRPAEAQAFRSVIIVSQRLQEA